MISVKDRVPRYPGRVHLNPVSGNMFDLTRADDPTDPGSPLNRRMMQLLQADIRTLPVSSGQTIAAGDVVDVVGGAITKAGTPSQAIALQPGIVGQSIDIIMDGVAELSGITAGTKITSNGVQGYAPQDGWLWVKPEWDKGQRHKLKEITTTVSSSTVNIDLSGINWADYLQTEIYITASFSDIPFVRVRFNGKSGDTDYKTWAGTGQGNDSAYICGTTVGDSGKGGMKITIPCNVTSVSVHCKGIGNSFSNTLGYVTAASGITFSNLNQMNLSPISGALPAGVKIAVYGVKK